MAVAWEANPTALGFGVLSSEVLTISPLDGGRFWEFGYLDHLKNFIQQRWENIEKLSRFANHQLCPLLGFARLLDDVPFSCAQFDSKNLLVEPDRIGALTEENTSRVGHR